jgi:DNA-binding transcriptional MerR regulator
VARKTPSRLFLLALLAAGLAPAGCRRAMTEQEALESAREEIRREYQPEIDRRKREIAELQRQIEAAKKRLADRKTQPAPARAANPTP